MCVAILEVTYKASAASKRDMIELEDETHLESRIEALKNNDNVERIRIFRREQTLTRTTIWTPT